MSDKCPVCYAKMTVDVSVIDVYEGMGPECERYEDCLNHCFAYDYQYGYSAVHVNIRGHDLLFGWTYHDDWTTTHALSEAINIVVKAAQACQLEDYWNLVHGRDSGNLR